jgi:hypothetical protein
MLTFNIRSTWNLTGLPLDERSETTTNTRPRSSQRQYTYVPFCGMCIQKKLTIIGWIVVRRTNKAERFKIRNQSGNVALVNTLSFRQHVQLSTNEQDTCYKRCQQNVRPAIDKQPTEIQKNLSTVLIFPYKNFELFASKRDAATRSCSRWMNETTCIRWNIHSAHSSVHLKPQFNSNLNITYDNRTSRVHFSINAITDHSVVTAPRNYKNDVLQYYKAVVINIGSLLFERFLCACTKQNVQLILI